ncbi:MAG: hypothetical protein VB143_06450, partial [Burkholderia sp.]
IEPMFSDFKTRGCRLEGTQIRAPERLDRLLLIMTLAMSWCVNAGRADALPRPPKKSVRASRSGSLVRAQGRSKCALMVHARSAIADSPCS